MKPKFPEGDRRGLDLSAALRILEHAGRLSPGRAAVDDDEQLQKLIDALCDLTVHDGLTGLVNATFFHAALATEIDRSARTGRTCALLAIDLDYFKSINDSYGHEAGDRVLQAAARFMRRSLRGMDTAARIGGEEFAVILPECPPEAAIQAARRIHGSLNPFTVECAGTALNLTSSAGLAWTEPRRAESARELMARADREMYRAKKSGRHQLCYPAFAATEITSHERSVLLNSTGMEAGDDR